MNESVNSIEFFNLTWFVNRVLKEKQQFIFFLRRRPYWSVQYFLKIQMISRDVKLTLSAVNHTLTEF